MAERVPGIFPAPYLAALSEAQREESWRRHLEDPPPGFGLFVAENAEGPVGFVAVGAARGADDGGGEVLALYLLEAYQGRGLGRALLRRGAASLFGNGYRSLFLWVLAEASARGFYEAMGGRELRRSTVTIAGQDHEEVGYGWGDLAGWLRSFEA